MATFQQGAQQAVTLTEKELASHWNTVLTAYRTAIKNIDAELAAVYARYLTDKDPANYYNIMIQRDRLTKLQNAVRAEYTAASIAAGRETAVSSTLGISNTYYRNQYTMTFFQPEIMSFVPLQNGFIEAAVSGTEASWKAIKAIDTYGNPAQYLRPTGTLVELLRKNRVDDLNKLNSTIISGLRQGKSYQNLMSDVRGVIGRERVVDGVRQLTGSKYNAMRILRTEGTRVMNAGMVASIENAKNQGVDMYEIWDATLDINTRGSHQSADGQRRDKDGLFHVNGSTGIAPGQMSSSGENINCRCSISPRIEGMEPTVRRGRNPETGESEVFSYKNYDSWAESNGLTKDKNGVWKQKK